jgi:Protein of unknown function (DUF642)
MNRTIVACALLLAARVGSCSAFQSPGGELLVNGSFESPVVQGIDQQFTAPSTDIAGWTVTERTVDINRTSEIFGTAHSGNQMIDVNGQDNGTLEQSFPTTAGRPYWLTLQYANNPNPSLSSSVYNADVSLFGSGMLYTEFLTHAGSLPSDMQWALFSHVFMANSSTTTLQLRSRMLGFNGVVFDSVSVVNVPEPSWAILTALAVVGVRRGGADCRRRRGAGVDSWSTQRVLINDAGMMDMNSADK